MAPATWPVTAPTVSASSPSSVVRASLTARSPGTILRSSRLRARRQFCIGTTRLRRSPWGEGHRASGPGWRDPLEANTAARLVVFSTGRTTRLFSSSPTYPINRRRLVAFQFFCRRRVMSDVGDQRGKTHVPAGKRFDPRTAQDREDIAGVWDGRIVSGRQQHRDRDNRAPDVPTPFTIICYCPAMDDLAKQIILPDRPALARGLALSFSAENILVPATAERPRC